MMLRQKIIFPKFFAETYELMQLAYICAGKVLYDQLPLNPARAGRQQR